MAMDLMTAANAPIFVLTGLCVIVFSALFMRFWPAKIVENGHDKLPPLYAGWMPWIGCAVEFGKAPASFLEQKRKEMGSVYTLLVAGERMTLLSDPEDITLFFQSSSLDFQKGVQAYVQTVSLMSKEAFVKYHTKMHDVVKGKLSGTNLRPMFFSLRQGFLDGLDNLDSGDYELHDIVRRVMYRTVLDNVFGKGTLPTADQAKYKELEQHFLTFDDQFEYGIQLPTFFLRDWSNSRSWLLQLFTKAVQKYRQPKDNEQKSLFQALMETVDTKCAPHYSMMLMWASLANAIPIMLWTLTFMLTDEKVLEKAKSEVTAKVGANGEVNEENMASMTYLKYCILEGIRIRSPGILTRRVVEPVKVKDMTIPAGDLVIVSPLWAHRNPRLFPDPDKYIPERWEKADVEKNVYLDGFISFGGGRFQCPGRWFAMLELQLFLALFLQRFDCKLQVPVPDMCRLHLVGVPQPVGPCPVHLKKL